MSKAAVEIQVEAMPRARKLLKTAEVLCHLLIVVLTKFWKMTSAGLLSIILVFWFQGGLFASLLLVAGILGLFYNAQDMLLYHPDQPPHSRMLVDTPASVRLPFENHFVQTSDGTTINIVFVKQPKPDAPTLLYFHGNAGNIGHRLTNVYGLYLYCGFNIVQVEYRGYGKSSGSVSEAGLYQDAEAAMDFLLKRSDIDKTRILAFGRSLGGAVAIHLAATPRYSDHVRVLIVENTFTSIPDISKVLFDFQFIHYLPFWAYKNQYPSQRRLASVHVPTLMLSGQQDQLIPPSMMQTLYESSVSTVKRLVRLEGGTHNESWMCPGYYEAIQYFVQEVLKNPSPVHRNLSATSIDMDATVKNV